MTKDLLIDIMQRRELVMQDAKVVGGIECISLKKMQIRPENLVELATEIKESINLIPNTYGHFPFYAELDLDGYVMFSAVDYPKIIELQLYNRISGTNDPVIKALQRTFPAGSDYERYLKETTDPRD
jgi:hypothetical protein